MGFEWRTWSEEELIVMEVITVCSKGKEGQDVGFKNTVKSLDFR